MIQEKERKLASIQLISEISPIEGADNIERVKINGWFCVAKKGEFKVGEKCIYFEIDSLLPLTQEFEFLKNGGTKIGLVDGKEVEGYRLRTIKLRGQISQGLALPLYVFNIIGEVGEDLTKKLNINKFEEPLPKELLGTAKGMMPSFLSKTSEERIQNLVNLLEKYKGYKFVGTEKVDGTSSTYYINNGEFGICSKSVEFVLNIENIYTRIEKKYNIKEKLVNYNKKYGKNIGLQGEIAGPGVGKNPLNLEDISFFAFNIYDIDTGYYYSFEEFKNIIKELDIPQVPILFDNFILPKTIEELLELADQNSSINKSKKQEGIVFKLIQEKNDPEFGRVSFKVISNKYLLKNE